MLSTFLRSRTGSLSPLSRVCTRRYSTPTGPNQELIRELTRYMEGEQASSSSNSYKVRAYSKAINAIGQLQEPVCSVEQVKDLDGIGVRIAKRIEAFLSGVPYEPETPETPKRTRASKADKSLAELRREQVTSSLSSISGLGKSMAGDLYDAGCRSLVDLKKPEFMSMLNRTQQLGARYSITADRAVSFEQASTVRDFVEQNVSSRFTVLLSGDFRRGAQRSQHVTLLILHPRSNSGIFPPNGSPTTETGFIRRSKRDAMPAPFTGHSQNKVNHRGLSDDSPFSTEILSPLECRGLLAASYTAGAQMWHGIIRVPERVESSDGGNGWEARADRIQAVANGDGQFFSAEIYYVPQECMGAASIALTGDSQFNITARKAAVQIGQRLNEHGLWRWREATVVQTGLDEEKSKSIEEFGGYWELAASEKEEDILESIGMNWVPPERRNFNNLPGRRKKSQTDEQA